MEMLIAGWEVLRRIVRTLGPYVMLEMVLPGGTLFALALYLYRSGWFAQAMCVLRALLVRISEFRAMSARRTALPRGCTASTQ
jgi:hypothetical protein